MRLRRLSTTLSLAVAVALAGPLATAASAQAAADHRVVVYYQTQFDNGSYVSPKELTDHDTGVTDVIVGAVHLNGDGSVTLNDNSPDDAKFDQMWSDLAAVQSKGVHVLGMVGGAAVGSFQRLDSDFDTYYPKLKNVVSTHHLDGLDLDVEEGMSLVGVERVIDQLHSDFGDGFLVTLAPVATALNGEGTSPGSATTPSTGTRDRPSAGSTRSSTAAGDRWTAPRATRASSDTGSSRPRRWWRAP